MYFFFLGTDVLQVNRKLFTAAEQFSAIEGQKVKGRCPRFSSSNDWSMDYWFNVTIEYLQRPVNLEYFCGPEGNKLPINVLRKYAFRFCKKKKVNAINNIKTLLRLVVGGNVFTSELSENSS